MVFSPAGAAAASASCLILTGFGWRGDFSFLGFAAFLASSPAALGVVAAGAGSFDFVGFLRLRSAAGFGASAVSVFDSSVALVLGAGLALGSRGFFSLRASMNLPATRSLTIVSAIVCTSLLPATVGTVGVHWCPPFDFLPSASTWKFTAESVSVKMKKALPNLDVNGASPFQKYLHGNCTNALFHARPVFGPVIAGDSKGLMSVTAVNVYVAPSLLAAAVRAGRRSSELTRRYSLDG